MGDSVKRTKGTGLVSDEILQYVNENSLELHPCQAKLIELTLKVKWNIMLGATDELQLLQNLCRMNGAKKTLDIGVYTGYSALSIALVLPEGGKVIACDVTDEFAKVGMPIWKEAGVDGKIDLRLGPAVTTLQSLIDNGESETFDFAFIDADKSNYDTYYEQCLKLVRKGGIIALDNMLWHGKVVNPLAQDADTKAIQALNAKIHKDDRVYKNLLTIGDGTCLCFKK